jgi:hypothetical protein
VVRELKPIGAYAKDKVRKYLTVFLLFFVPFVILYFTAYDYLPTYIDLGRLNTARGFLMGIISMCAVFFGFSNYYTWKMGLNGEAKVVKNISANLDDKYSLFNDVILVDIEGKRRGNIDHIIVGPNGVFTIETKHVSHEISYDGKNWTGIRGNPSCQAISHAVRVRNVLLTCPIFKSEARASNPFVKAILVFSHKKCVLKIPDSKSPKSCTVLKVTNKADKSIANFILKEGYKFSNDEVTEIEEYLKSKIVNFEKRTE